MSILVDENPSFIGRVGHRRLKSAASLALEKPRVSTRGALVMRGAGLTPPATSDQRQATLSCPSS